MTYQKDFKSRNKFRIGEEKAKEYYKSKNVFIERYGLDLLDSGLSVGEFCKIPKIVRNTPDFIAINKDFAFIEAKAFKGELLRLKVCDMDSYTLWSSLGDFVFYIWSITNNKGIQIRYENMVRILNKCNKGVYKDNKKEYYEIPWDLLKAIG